MEEKKFTSIEEALAKREELLTKLNEYNNMIFENQEEINTEDFSNNYQELQNKLDKVDEYLSKKN